MANLSDLRTVASFWLGPTLPKLRALCAQSWLSHGYDVVIYSPEPRIDGLPKGCEVRHCDELLPLSELDRWKSPYRAAFFSDILRMKMMLENKGIWLDLDYLMLRPFTGNRPFILGKETKDRPCNAVMWFPADHPIPNVVIETFGTKSLGPWAMHTAYTQKWAKLLTLKRFTYDDLPNGHWGRHVLTHFVKKLDMTGDVLPQKAFFHPGVYNNTFYEPSAFNGIVKDPEILGLHFFEKSQENADWPKGSLLRWAEETFC